MTTPTTRHREIGCLCLGFLLGSLFTAALGVHAQCCAQFDVPFNEQLEQEHWRTVERANAADVELPRYQFPALPCEK